MVYPDWPLPENFKTKKLPAQADSLTPYYKNIINPADAGPVLPDYSF